MLADQDIDDWLVYFQANPTPDQVVDWTLPASLTPAEHRALDDSIASFQLGEYSEGRNLLRAASDFADAHDDQRFLEITRLFIREEQHHAGVLARFMREAGIPVIRRHWTDTIFRGLRRHVGYELTVTVLVSAEMIALAYYQALSQASGSLLLQQICAKLLDDEQAHVSWESALLHAIRQRHGPARLLLTRAAHWVLFHGALAIVMILHRRVIRRSELRGTAFLRLARQVFRRGFETAALPVPGP